MHGLIRGLPGKMRQAFGEINSMLTCAAANLQYLTGVGENPFQDSKNGVFVIFASLLEGFVHFQYLYLRNL